MSCYGTAPAAELAQCFWRFLSFFPFLVEVLLPSTPRVSSTFLPYVHALGMKSWFMFCMVELLALVSRVPYLHQTVQDNARFHDDFDSGGVMLHGSLEAIRQDSEGIFSHPPCAGL